MVLGCPVFEQCPLPFWVPHACHAMNSEALPSCLLFVLLRALMFSLTSRCVFVFVHLSVCFFVARSILFVARVRLHIPCVGSRLDSWPEVLHWFDLLAPLFVDEHFRCAGRFCFLPSAPRCVPLCFAQFLFLSSLVDRDAVPVFLARQLVCFLDYRD